MLQCLSDGKLGEEDCFRNSFEENADLFGPSMFYEVVLFLSTYITMRVL